MSTILDALGAPLHLPEQGTTSTPRIGDLWEIAWDGKPLAIVLIAGLRDTYVMAWPITAPTGRETFPCFTLITEPLGNLVVWPDAEFGLTRAALRRCIIPDALPDKDIRMTLGALEGINEPPHEFCDGPESDDADADLLAVCSQAWTLGDIDWPTLSNAGVIRSETWDAAGLTPRDIGRLLGSTPARAADLYAGEVAPTEQEIARLEAAAPSGIEYDLPDGVEVVALMHPKFKQRIEELAARQESAESKARDGLLPMSRVAARQSSEHDALEAAMHRVDAALNAALDD